jgi:RNA polymerase sigma-70 factor (ECF subfamily)
VAQAGETGAFEELMRIFERPVFNLAYRMVNHRGEAADLTQDIFVKLYRSLPMFRGESRFSTWLYALAANMCRSRLRKLRRISSVEAFSLDESREGEAGRPATEPVDPRDPPAAEIEREELRRQIEASVAELPRGFRIVLVMRDMQGMAYEEIAAALRCSMGTVKSRLARARIRLQEKLRRKGLSCGSARR